MSGADAVAAGQFRRSPAERASHLYACWAGWAFDHSGWHLEVDVLEVNAQFKRRLVSGRPVYGDAETFCRRNHLRPPDGFWRDPRPRAPAYVDRFEPVWRRGAQP